VSEVDVETTTRSVVEAFVDAINRGDVEAMAALAAEDIVFDGTTPPDGVLLLGRSEVRQLWEELARANPRASVEVEDMVIAGIHCTARVRYVFDRDNPDGGHVRAVDVMKVENESITEMLSYVKG